MATAATTRAEAEGQSCESILAVEPVRSKRELSVFLNMDLSLYADRPLYAPPFRHDLARRIRKWASSAQLFIARRGSRPVGRIAASIDSVKNRDTKCATGAFGMFECRDDAAAAGALFQAAEGWLAKRGVRRVLGPYGFTQEDPYVGFLAEGFDLPPTFGTTYSLEYYPRMVEEAEYRPVMDLLSYAIDSNKLPEPIAEKAIPVKQRPEVTVRPIEMKRVWDEARLIKNIFNGSLNENWEFVPFTDAQVKGMVQELRLVADPRVVLFVEVRGEAAGCVINIPCYNDVLRACRGRLFPTGLLRLLLAKGNRSRLRPYALGVLPRYRREGLAGLLIYETFIRGAEAGYTTGEVTWVLENNTAMNDLAAQFARPERKVHKIYEKYLEKD